MKTSLRYLLVFIFSFGLLLQKAQASFHVPELTGPVVDSAGLISSQDQRFLEDLLLRFQSQAQIQVLTIPSLEGDSIESVSIQVTDQWKLGDKKKDNGVLLLIAAKEKKIRIEVGQGLEGVIPDVIAKRIISDVMVPVFRQGSVSKGIVVGVYQIIHTIDPKFENASTGVNDDQGFSVDQEESLKIKDFVIAIIFIFFFIFLSFFNRRGGGGFGGGYMGGGGFGGGFSGSSGGGWSGGGGGFSGGGSSGNW